MQKQLTRIQMRWGDIDQFGHVYNGYYQHYFDLGKVDYFGSVLGISANWAESGEGFLNVQTTSNYYKPVKMCDNLEVCTIIEKIGTKSLTMFQELTINGEVYSDSRCVMVYFNHHTGTTSAVPDSIRTVCGL